MHFQTHLKILAVEPQPNGMTLIEAAAPDGTNAMIVTRVVEPLAVGGELALTLIAEPAAMSRSSATLRDRMNGRLAGSAAAMPRSASSAASTHATGPASTPAITHTAASATGASSTPRGASAMGEASSLLFSTILGGPSPTSSASVERDAASMDRDVDDEMDALLGAPPRKG